MEIIDNPNKIIFTKNNPKIEIKIVEDNKSLKLKQNFNPSYKVVNYWKGKNNFLKYHISIVLFMHYMASEFFLDFLECLDLSEFFESLDFLECLDLSDFPDFSESL